MDTVVLKFGGSSVADNIKLNVVAEKIKTFCEEKKKVVVVVSAQGKTTDGLIKEALSLSSVPDERELDVLLSVGEQITISKLAILLNRLEIPAISLTGWQAGIFTNNTNQDAIIEDINVSRIQEELEKGKVVVVAGFQGINENMDITTLGRGGSDTTAVAIAAKLNAEKCIIFSDVDGVYTTDPNQTKVARKLDTLSYTEMIDVADEGAKVLHNRCVEIGEKYNIPIIAKSTFKESTGTVISDKIEGALVKNIVKNDNIKYVWLEEEGYSLEKFNILYKSLINNEIGAKSIINNSTEDKLKIQFTISSSKFNKLAKSLEDEFPNIKSEYTDITRLSIIGNGIMSNNTILSKIIGIIEEFKLEIINIEVSETKISVIFNKVISNDIIENLHINLI